MKIVERDLWHKVKSSASSREIDDSDLMAIEWIYAALVIESVSDTMEN